MSWVVMKAPSMRGRRTTMKSEAVECRVCLACECFVRFPQALAEN